MPKRAKRRLVSEELKTTTATTDSKSVSDQKSASDKRDKRASSQGAEAKALSRSRTENLEVPKQVKPPLISPVARRNSRFRDQGKDSIFSFRVFDQDKGDDGGYDSAIDEDSEPFYIKLLNKDKHEVGQLKSHQLQPLKNLADSIVSYLISDPSSKY